MLIQDLFKNKQMEFVKGYAETKSVKSYVFLLLSKFEYFVKTCFFAK